jgi:serine/threonine protein kinase
LKKMNALKQEHIVRFITAFRRHSEEDEYHYLMFEWANGGNLRTLWESFARRNATPSLVKAVVQQFLGLAEALRAAHYLPNKSAYRHGDLKPENILWFRDGSELGKLKIGDWGEAKEHHEVTELRPFNTSAAYGTRRYEAPEAETGLTVNLQSQAPKRRSRLYDIWAFGCITMEFVVWLLYGGDGLKKFNTQVRDQHTDSSPFYQISIGKNGEKFARTHDAVKRWMEHMSQDPACKVGTTALGNILELLKDGLLVVKLPKRMGSNLSDMETAQLSPTRSARSYTGMSLDEKQGPEHYQPTEGSPSKTDMLVPLINIIPTDASDEAVQSDIEVDEPAQPVPNFGGPGRMRAIDLRSRLEDILLGEEEEGESYWFLDVARLPPPDLMVGSQSHPPSQPDEYQTEETVYGTSTRPLTDTRGLVVLSEGLTAPLQERVPHGLPYLLMPTNIVSRW